MSRLTTKAPTAIVINGQEYPIDTNYRVCIDTILALGDEGLTPTEKLSILLHNLYGGVPENPQQAVEQALQFLSGGEKQQEKAAAKLCDFQQDGEYIYAAMLKKGIDLDTLPDMHWWTFLAHFAELPECTFKRIVYLRSRLNSGKLSKEEKQEAAAYGWGRVMLQTQQSQRAQEEKQEATKEIENLLGGSAK